MEWNLLVSCICTVYSVHIPSDSFTRVTCVDYIVLHVIYKSSLKRIWIHFLHRILMSTLKSENIEVYICLKLKILNTFMLYFITTIITVILNIIYKTNCIHNVIVCVPVRLIASFSKMQCQSYAWSTPIWRITYRVVLKTRTVIFLCKIPFFRNCFFEKMSIH